MCKIIHHGACHCGRLRFEVRAPAEITAINCNCTICAMTGFLHLIVAKKDFQLLQGEQDLCDYQFNTKTAHHLFCKHCGIKSFYIPRSHPDGISVNVNCLDQASIKAIRIEDFDGQHWEEAAEKL